MNILNILRRPATEILTKIFFKKMKIKQEQYSQYKRHSREDKVLAHKKDYLKRTH